MVKNKTLSYLFFTVGIGVAVFQYYANFISPVGRTPAAAWVLSIAITIAILYRGYRELRDKYPETYFEDGKNNTSNMYGISLNTAEEQKKDSLTKDVQPMVMFCRKCGVKLEEGSLFCNKCGTKVVVPGMTDETVLTMGKSENDNAQKPEPAATTGWRRWKDILGL